MYVADGAALGTIRDVDEDGFVATTGDGVEAPSVQHERDRLVWRCSQCGAVGDLGTLLEACPDCNTPREDRYYWTED